MTNEEFQELRAYHLSKPENKIRSARKGGPGRLGDLYREVREINWNRECKEKNDIYNEKYEK
jgi:hypothetical protein